MDIKELLTLLDCSDGEKETFIALLSSPDGISVVGLSKKLNMPRPTLYGYVDGLREKGLVRKGLQDTGARFYAEDAAHITQIFNEKILNLEKIRGSIDNALLKYAVKESSTPRFTVYEGGDAYAKVFRDMLISGEKEIYSIWPLSEMSKLIPEKVFFDFHTERVRRGIWLNVLWPHSRKISLEKHPLMLSLQEQVSLRRIRILPPGLDQTLGYTVYGSKVAFTSSKRESYSFIIESKELSDAHKNHFHFLWKLSKKYSR